MRYLSLKDQSDGTKVRRSTWADDEEAREDLKRRAKAMLLEIEKRQRKRHRKVTLSPYNSIPWGHIMY